jgi:serine/threonine-protein kinase
LTGLPAWAEDVEFWAKSGQPSSMTSQQPLASVSPGDVLAGKYRVERVLGVGGMGVVVAAHHIQLDEKVALKFLLPHALESREAVGRFLQEARAAVKIKSEHVARVSDVGELESGAPYMVMEYLEGSDLASWLEQRGALPIDQAVEFVLQACVAVADAHALGIVHRDLKPANLFCVRRSDGQLTIKVLDFGISKMKSPDGGGVDAAVTRTSALMGTPLYMSPEQMRSSKDVDARTDIWALGAILYQLMAGSPPFLAESVTDLAIKVANEPPPSVRSFRPDAPPELEAVILKCLEKGRDQRYRNVGQLSVALLPFATKRAKGYVERIAGIIQSAGLSESALALPASPRDVAMPGLGEIAGGTMPGVGRTTGGASKGKATVIRGGIAAVMFVGAAATFLAMSKRQEPLQDGLRAATSPAETASVAPTPVVPPAEQAKPVEAKLADPPTPHASSEPAPPPAAAPKAAASDPARALAPAKSSAAPSHAAAPAAPKARANCDPPYFFDARGNRNFKPECL